MMAMPEVTDLLSSADVAAALEIDTSRVRQLARQYGLGRRIAGVRLYTPEDVARLRERKTQPGPAKGFSRVSQDRAETP